MTKPKPETDRKYRQRAKLEPVRPHPDMLIHPTASETAEYWRQILRLANDGTSRLMDIYLGRIYAPRGDSLSLGCALCGNSPHALVVSEVPLIHERCKIQVKARISRFVARVLSRAVADADNWRYRLRAAVGAGGAHGAGRRACRPAADGHG